MKFNLLVFTKDVTKENSRLPEIHRKLGGYWLINPIVGGQSVFLTTNEAARNL